MALAFYLLKIIATYLGAQGMGSLGHLMSIVSISTMLAGGGITNALIKYSAELKQTPKELARFISASISYSLAICLVTFVILIAFSSKIAVILFNDKELYWVIYILGLAQFVYAFNNHITGISSGLGDLKKIAFIQTVGATISIPLIFFLIINFSYIGAAISIVLSFTTAAIPAIFSIKKIANPYRITFAIPSLIEIKKLSQYSIMLLTSAIAFPIVEVLVRQFIINKYGYHQAGLWQALLKGTSAYLGFFNVFLAYYFVPQIIACKNNQMLRLTVKKMMLFILLIFSIGGSLIYMGRAFFLKLFLSEEFVELESYLHYQLLGDLFRVLSWVIAFVAVAKAKTKVYIGAEIFQSSLFLTLILVIDQYAASGILSVTRSYLICYALYLLVCAVYFSRYTKMNSR